MTDETIVAVYASESLAELVARELKAAGVPADAVSVHAGDNTDAKSWPTAGTRPDMNREPGFWASLFGGEPDHDTAVYERSVAGGSAVVTVRTPAAHMERVLEILEAHDPVNLEERAADYGMTQPAREAAVAPAHVTDASGRRATPGGALAQDSETIQLSEEKLAVGKRLVNRGGARIRRFVVETPVEQQVTLRDETVVVERRPVAGGRAVGNAEFTEKVVEMTETSEQVVVSKQAFVTEEIALRKQASERVETVRDTVRREDVEIEQIPGGEVAGAPAHVANDRGRATLAPDAGN